MFKTLSTPYDEGSWGETLKNYSQARAAPRDTPVQVSTEAPLSEAHFACSAPLVFAHPVFSLRTSPTDSLT